MSVPGQRPHGEYITVCRISYTAGPVEHTGNPLLGPVTRWKLKNINNHKIIANSVHFIALHIDVIGNTPHLLVHDVLHSFVYGLPVFTATSQQA